MSQSTECLEQWKHIEDAKERKKIQNRNAQRTYRERSKRRVEALEQLCKNPPHGAAYQRKSRCIETACPSRPMGTTDECVPMEDYSIQKGSPTITRTMTAGTTPPSDETYAAFQATCHNMDDISSAPLLDLSWALDPSVNICNSISTEIVPSIDKGVVASLDYGVKPANVGAGCNSMSSPTTKTLQCDGQTALHIAASLGRVMMVTTLLRMSADVLAKDSCGRTALHIAVEQLHEPIIAELVKHRSLLDQVNIRGETALHLAVEMENEAIVQLLLSAGSDLNVKDCDGRTALHMSAMLENEFILKLLLAQGADINART